MFHSWYVLTDHARGQNDSQNEYRHLSKDMTVQRGLTSSQKSVILNIWVAHQLRIIGKQSFWNMSEWDVESKSSHHLSMAVLFFCSVQITHSFLVVPWMLVEHSFAFCLCITFSAHGFQTLHMACWTNDPQKHVLI